MFLFTTFYIKFCLVQNLCGLDSVKYLDLLEVTMELTI